MKKFIKKFFITTLITSFVTSGVPSFSENKGNFNNEILKGDKDNKETFTKSDNELQKDLYILGPGDFVTISSLSIESINNEYEIFNDGSISIPLVGNIYISGLSFDQANKVIEKELSKQLINPIVTLGLSIPRPINVSIIGEIESPGVYTLSSRLQQESNVTGTNEQLIGFPKLINAIQLAGGITQKANIKKVILKRKLPGQNDDYKVAEIDLFELIINGDQSQNPFLFDGDVIKFNAVENNIKDLPTLSYFNVSPKEITVNIMGEVNNPGEFNLKSNTPLSQAIIAAGGPINWRANSGNVDLVRVNRDGSVTKKKYRINLNQDLSDEKNPPLRNNDSILVRRTNFARSTDAIKSVSDPFTGLVTIWTLFKLMGD